MKTLEQLKSTANLLIARVGADGGVGQIFTLGKPWASVIWSYGAGWEHVSVCPYKKSHTPTWDEMCRVKDMFFNEDETAVEYHPAKSEYVNNIPNCLHLWRPLKEHLPTPPSIMVGVKDGETPQQFLSELKKALQADESKGEKPDEK